MLAKEKPKETFIVGCLSCDSIAFCQTNKFILLETEGHTKALSRSATKETLGLIQTNLDWAEDTEFSIRMQLFTNVKEVNFDKNEKEKSISI